MIFFHENEDVDFERIDVDFDRIMCELYFLFFNLFIETFGFFFCESYGSCSPISFEKFVIISIRTL